MERTHRIILSDALLPVQVFFNAISDNSFIRILKGFSAGVGAGFDIAACTFPGDLDEYEDPLAGIEFSLPDGESVILSFHDFFDILIQVCSVYMQDHPEDETVIKELQDKIKKLISEPNSPVFLPGHNVEI